MTWAALAAAVGVPIVAAGFSPQLAWRHPVYIAAGFAGIVALALLLVQPMLMSGILGGLSPSRTRQLHQWAGGLLVVAVIAHVGGLWITSPPDVIDALLFDSPTPFSPWGVVAMWGLFLTALLAAFRRRLRLQPRIWRTVHLGLAVLVAGATVVHALLIEGTMETASKAALCGFIAIALAAIVVERRLRRRI